MLQLRCTPSVLTLDVQAAACDAYPSLPAPASAPSHADISSNGAAPAEETAEVYGLAQSMPTTPRSYAKSTPNTPQKHAKSTPSSPHAKAIADRGALQGLKLINEAELERAVGRKLLGGSRGRSVGTRANHAGHDAALSGGGGLQPQQLGVEHEATMHVGSTEMGSRAAARRPDARDTDAYALADAWATKMALLKKGAEKTARKGAIIAKKIARGKALSAADIALCDWQEQAAWISCAAAERSRPELAQARTRSELSHLLARDAIADTGASPLAEVGLREVAIGSEKEWAVWTAVVQRGDRSDASAGWLRSWAALVPSSHIDQSICGCDGERAQKATCRGRMTISDGGSIVTADECAKRLLGLSHMDGDVCLKQLMPFPLNQPHRRIGSSVGESTMTVGHMIVPALPLACSAVGSMLLVYLRHKQGACLFSTFAIQHITLLLEGTPAICDGWC